MDFAPLPKPRLWKSKADFFKPFRSAAADAGENIVPLFDPTLHRTEAEDLDLRDLNTALTVLVEVFPDVQPEVFREMLVSISEESRLQVVTEHLLSKKSKWVRGRYRTAETSGKVKLKKHKDQPLTANYRGDLPDEETFRSDRYKKAVKQVLYQEFKNLSHSSIRAVLAEQNFSYTLARPVLQQLSTRSWRLSFALFWPKKSPAAAASEHPFVVWQPGRSGDNQATPAVKRTSSAQLDQELYDLFVGPVIENQRQALLAGDHALASTLNEEEAEEAGAMFDCECCYSSVPFERLSTCDDGCHQLCFDCVRRTVSEALFGQGWARLVDLEKSTIRCFAPATHECNGIVPGSILRRALSHGTEKEDTWNEFQERAAAEALVKSRLALQRCPFCTYVEVDETPTPRRRTAFGIGQYITSRTSPLFQWMLLSAAMVLILFTGLIVLWACVLWMIVQIFPTAAAILDSSWSRVYKQRRGLTFKCRNPSCSKTSCIRCAALWRDPHTCFENEKTSLRTAIESSATAAVKRTCPKCLLSFVKSSGCNKLVCNCGYTMCYICRQEITAKEGYGHFCQHFRPHGGRCSECDRCDLYGDEDEEAAIRKAAEAAEKAWKEKEGGSEGDEKASQAMVNAVIGRAKTLKYWELCLDAVMDAVVA